MAVRYDIAYTGRVVSSHIVCFELPVLLLIARVTKSPLKLSSHSRRSLEDKESTVSVLPRLAEQCVLVTIFSSE